MPTTYTWLELTFPQPYAADDAVELLHCIAADPALGPVVLELRREHGLLRFLVGAALSSRQRVMGILAASANAIRAIPLVQKRRSLDFAAQLIVNQRGTFVSGSSEASARLFLTALVEASDTESLVTQVLLGDRVAPQRLPLQSSFTSMPTSEASTRPERHGFVLALRVGVDAEHRDRAHELVEGIVASVRLALGVTSIRLRPEPAELLDRGARARRGVITLAADAAASVSGWPIGDRLPGLPSFHPRPLAPTRSLIPSERVFAVTTAPGYSDGVGIPIDDARMGTLLVGPNGVGKSTAMLHLALADAEAGRGFLFIDPKSDAIRDLLMRIPEHRRDDVVVLDPSDLRATVGLDLFSGSGQNPWLTADAVLSAFRQAWSENWGVRSEEIALPLLQTVARVPGANLLWLPRILTDDDFRGQMLSGLDRDPLGIDLFWARFNDTPPGPRAVQVQPLLTKLQDLYLRPSLRATLGQSAPQVRLDDIFRGRIILADLNVGRLGEGVSRLLGSLMVGSLWSKVLGRADLPPEERTPAGLYIDEIQSYLAVPGSGGQLSDALAQARGLGMYIVGAHQHRGQLSEEMLAGFDANLRSKLYFKSEDPDATVVAGRTAQLEAEDLRSLPKYEIYCNVMQDGESTGWLSGRTLPLAAPLRDANDLREHSRARYGVAASITEQELIHTLGLETSSSQPEELVSISS